MKRMPCQAGSFYEAEPGPCRRAAKEMIDAAALPADLPEELFGGVVPHAGWVFSGRTAALTLKALTERGRLGRVVLFGADHWGIGNHAAVYDEGSWETPLGEVAVDEQLAAAMLAACPLLRSDVRAHTREHSLEVQLPLMRMLREDVRIVPVTVPPNEQAVEVGSAVGKVLKESFPEASVVGSTDLTHYGPQYSFTPGGVGAGGLAWAAENDRRLLELVEGMQSEKIIDETNSRMNACGGGALAATMAACSIMGADRGVLLGYTTSAEVMKKTFRAAANDAVGYAAVVFA